MVILPQSFCNDSQLVDRCAVRTLVNLNSKNLPEVLMSVNKHPKVLAHSLVCRAPVVSSVVSTRVCAGLDRAGYTHAVTLMGVRFRGLGVTVAIWSIAAQ